MLTWLVLSWAFFFGKTLTWLVPSSAFPFAMMLTWLFRRRLFPLWGCWRGFLVTGFSLREDANVAFFFFLLCSLHALLVEMGSPARLPFARKNLPSIYMSRAVIVSFRWRRDHFRSRVRERLSLERIWLFRRPYSWRSFSSVQMGGRTVRWFGRSKKRGIKS